MAVFTIFNHGTGGYTGKAALECKEIVNIFGNEVATTQQEFLDYMITEGVGGKGDPERLKLAFQGGALYQDRSLSAEDVGKALLATVNPLYGLGVMLGKTSVVKSMLGTGVDQNVANAVTVLSWLRTNGHLPDTINMMGWSRGAVTCIRIAYALKQLGNSLSDVPVNIFAVDPVAGAGHNSEVGAKTLTDNVRNYVATLALNEKRAAFTPMDHRLLEVVDAARSNVLILPLGGIHSDTAKWNNPAGRITFNLCCRFLQTHWTRLPISLGMFKMSNQGMLTQYNLLRKKPKDLHKSDRVKLSNPKSDVFKGGWNFFGGRKDIQRSDVVDDIDFFVNSHHMGVFRRVHRMAFDAYFGTGRHNRGTESWAREWLPRLAGDPATKNLTVEDSYFLNNLGPANPTVFQARHDLIMANNGLVD
jgi:hypothetical protein